MVAHLGLVLLPLAPVGLALSIVGFQQVDPSARPPMGRRRQAIAGVVLGALGTLLCLVSLAWSLAR